MTLLPLDLKVHFFVDVVFFIYTLISSCCFHLIVSLFFSAMHLLVSLETFKYINDSSNTFRGLLGNWLLTRDIISNFANYTDGLMNTL